MKTLIRSVLLLLLTSTPLFANHGVTLTWTASTSQASCVSPCTYTYLIYEGPASGQESTSTLISTSGLTATDDGPTIDAYSGTTRCYIVKFQESLNGTVTTSGPSNEACFSFPQAALTGPTGLAGTIH